MSKYPKLGKFRYCVRQVREKYGVTPFEFDIILYLADVDSATKGELLRWVSNSMDTMRIALPRLEKKGMIKRVVDHMKSNIGMGARYSIALKGRRMITIFYTKLFPNY